MSTNNFKSRDEGDPFVMRTNCQSGKTESCNEDDPRVEHILKEGEELERQFIDGLFDSFVKIVEKSKEVYLNANTESN